MLGIVPLHYSVNILNLFDLSFIKDCLNVLRWIRHLLCSYNTLKNFLRVCLVLIMDNSRAINQINSFGQCDILPNFCLTRDWSDFTAMLFHKCIDNRGFTDVWISNKTNTDIFLVFMQDVELLQQLDQRSFSERIGNTCLKC